MFKPLLEFSEEDVLRRVPEGEIFLRYFNLKPHLTEYQKNPLREDNSPGCKFFKSDNGKILFHDFSYGKTWDCFNLLKDKFNISRREAIHKINKDYDLRLDTTTPREVKIEPEYPEPVKKESQFSLKINKDFSESEMQYWKQYGITRKILEFYRVHSVSKVFKDSKICWKSTAKNPIFAYLFQEKSAKLYRPLSPSSATKWMSVNSGGILQGSEQLDLFGNMLIITSSLKDVMTLRSLGYNAMAPQSESANLGNLEYTKRLYDKVILFYDNDKAGRENAEKWKHLFSGTIFLDTCKDISDYYKKYGRWKTKQKMWTLLSYS